MKSKIHVIANSSDSRSVFCITEPDPFARRQEKVFFNTMQGKKVLIKSYSSLLANYNEVEFFPNIYGNAITEDFFARVRSAYPTNFGEHYLAEIEKIRVVIPKIAMERMLKRVINVLGKEELSAKRRVLLSQLRNWLSEQEDSFVTQQNQLKKFSKYLNVTSLDVDDRELKRLFRKATFVYHPDYNKSPRAGEEFDALRAEYQKFKRPEFRAKLQKMLKLRENQTKSDLEKFKESVWKGQSLKHFPGMFYKMKIQKGLVMQIGPCFNNFVKPEVV